MDINVNNNFTMFTEIPNKERKQELARKIAEKVEDGQVIGFGSGTTSYLAICEIAKKVKEENIKITAIPTSYETKILCAYYGIPTASLIEKKPDWSFDGADEVDNNNWLIKGRGAEMFKEKLNIKNSAKVYLLVDETKFVDKLCTKFPIPVECTPDSFLYVQEEIKNLGASEIKLRIGKAKDGPLITENGNFVLDCMFNEVYENLEKDLKSIVGVLETGLFIGYDNIIIEK